LFLVAMKKPLIAKAMMPMVSAISNIGKKL